VRRMANREGAVSMTSREVIDTRGGRGYAGLSVRASSGDLRLGEARTLEQTL